MSKKIPKKIIQHVNAYADVIKKEIPISDVYIFGSYAKGNAKSGSDVDVAIISTSFGKDPHEEGKWLQRKLWEVAYKNMDVVGYSPKDFSDLSSPLVYEIRKHGILVNQKA